MMAKKFILLVGVLFAGFCFCQNAQAAVSVNISSNGGSGPITVNDGRSSIVITWNSTGAVSCIAESSNYIWRGTKATSGAESAQIPNYEAGTYTYTITCTDSSGASAKADLVVIVVLPKVTLTVTGPTSVPEGGSTTVVWTAENVSWCRGDSGTGFTGNLNDTSGSKTVSFNYNPHILGAITERFTITCYGYNSKLVTASANVEVLPAYFPTVNIKANGSDDLITVKKGQPLSLTWDATNVYQCEISGDSLYTGLGTSGSQVINTSNKTGSVIYAINCRTANYSTVTDRVTINFSQESYATVDLKINNSDGPINLPLFSSLADISWTTFGGVTSCTASSNKDSFWAGVKSASGGTEKIGNFSAVGAYVYTISCAGPLGNVSDSVTVNVSQTTVELKVNGSDGPISIDSGNRVQLTWTTNQANSCTASGDTSWAGVKSASGGPVYSDYVTSSKTYTLTCKDALNNSVSDNVVVNVGSATQNCTSNWVLATNWSTCSGGSQFKAYSDVNSCNPPTSVKPANQTQACAINCTPVLTCGDWSSCINNQKEKFCYNSCVPGIVQKETEACVSTGVCVTKWEQDSNYKCTGGKMWKVYADVNKCTTPTSAKPTDEWTLADCAVKCVSNWQLNEDWGRCESSQQQATYSDINRCTPSTSPKPQNQTRSCYTACTSAWVTMPWGTCVNKTQTRTVYDSRGCSPSNGTKPDLTRPCTPECTPNWQPLEWGACINSKKYRDFKDENKCNSAVIKERESANCSIDVNLVSVNLKANGSETGVIVASSSKVVLSWKSLNAVSCTAIGNWSGSKAILTTESLEVITAPVLAGNYVYGISCKGASGGTVDDSVTVKVSAEAPNVDLKANGSDYPVLVAGGSDIALTWSSSNTLLCTASGTTVDWSGSKVISGSETIKAPSTTGTYFYNLICAGVGGTAYDRVTVTVNSGGGGNKNKPVSVSLKVNNSERDTISSFSGKIDLAWSSLEATSCTAYGENWSGSKHISGKETVEISDFNSSSKEYQIVCKNDVSTASASVHVFPKPGKSAVTVLIDGITNNNTVTTSPGVRNFKLLFYLTNVDLNSCVTSGTWPEKKINLQPNEYSYIEYVSPPTQVGRYTYAITCQGIDNKVFGEAEIKYVDDDGTEKQALIKKLIQQIAILQAELNAQILLESR